MEPLIRSENAMLLGWQQEPRTSQVRVEMQAHDLTTHAFICGATGSGKTVLAKILLEEAAMSGIPTIAIDLKGDISSLAVPLRNFSRQEITPFLESKPDITPEKHADDILRLHSERLKRDCLSRADVARFRDRCSVGVFTPRSRKGIQLGMSHLTSAPEQYRALQAQDPEAVKNMINAQVSGILERVLPEAKAAAAHAERGLLEEIVHYAWENGIRIDGPEGLEVVVDLLTNPPMQSIGAMPVNSYLPPKDRLALARRLNSLLVGVQRLWYDGLPISDIDGLLARVSSGGKTPICIINLSELDTFADRAFAVSQVAYAVYLWMRRQPGTSRPRLVFFIDEIGGGGGRQAFFPSHPYTSPSKSALNVLLRQGRAFGVCCVFATQNPGDIDYKGLSNCQTWMIGRLGTKRDRDKILQGLSDAEVQFSTVDDWMTEVAGGEFVLRTANGRILKFRQRWLLSFHQVITASALSQLPDPASARPSSPSTTGDPLAEGIAAYQRRDFARAESLLRRAGDASVAGFYLAKILVEQRRLEDAEKVLLKCLGAHPDNAKARLLLGRVYRQRGRLDEARNELQAVASQNDSYVFAHFELGLVNRALGRNREALDCFRRTVELNPDYPLGHFNLARVLESEGMHKEALVHFVRSRTLDPDHGPSWLGGARALARIGRAEESRVSAEEALRRMPTSAEARQLLT